MTPYTFYVWGVLAVTLPSLWCALRVVPRGATADRVVKRCARLLLRACGCRLEVCGLRHLEDAVPAILVANHTSYLDAVVLLAALPIRYRFVVNHHAASWPFIGLAVRRSGHLIVDRASRAGRQACVRAMLQTVRDGLSLVVFPEGTIHPDGDDLLPFRPGAFQIAVRLGRPVVPVTLGGTRDVFQSIRRIRRGRLDVEIHPPITPADTGRREVARMRDDARRAIRRSVTEARAS
jgi:1-acyl-sn-glycerol-3-phosphate acyltransferase